MKFNFVLAVGEHTLVHSLDEDAWRTLPQISSTERPEGRLTACATEEFVYVCGGD